MAEESEEQDNQDVETIQMRKVVLYEKTHDFPINGINEQFKMGDVLLFRERQARRYVEELVPDVMDARYLAPEDSDQIAAVTSDDAAEVVEVPKEEAAGKVGKVGEVEKLKAQLRAMEGRAPPMK